MVWQQLVAWLTPKPARECWMQHHWEQQHKTKPEKASHKEAEKWPHNQSNGWQSKLEANRMYTWTRQSTGSEFESRKVKQTGGISNFEGRNLWHWKKLKFKLLQSHKHTKKAYSESTQAASSPTCPTWLLGQEHWGFPVWNTWKHLWGQPCLKTRPQSAKFAFTRRPFFLIP